MVESRAGKHRKQDRRKLSGPKGVKNPFDPVVKIVTCLVAVFRLFGADTVGWKSRPTLDHWRLCVSACGGDWLAFAKWKLAAFYSVYTDQPLPPAPRGITPLHGENRGMELPPGTVADRPAFLLGGRLARWQRARMATWTLEERLEFLFSIKQSKKGMPRAGREYLDQSARKTVDKLTTAKPPRRHIALRSWHEANEDAAPFGRGRDLYCYRDTIEAQLRRTVRELYAGKQYTSRDFYEPFFPSTSANYIRSRKEGGAVTEIIDVIRELELLLPERAAGGLLGRGFGGLEWGMVMDSGDETLLRGGRQVWVNDSVFRDRFVSLYDVLREKAMREEPVVSPVALPEALKVRVISKGPPFLNTYLKPVQRFCWKVLADHPAFAVEGPVDEWVLQSRLGARLPDGEKYLSGDYSAATDELLPWVSNVIADEISEVCGFSGVDRALFLRSLTGHVFDDGRPQANGQLMGSVTSFPVLCIANAALCRYAYEQGHMKKVTLRTWPGLVNGDDIAMRCNSETRDIWGKVTSFAGLIESVGKTYFDRRFVEINSRCYVRREESVEAFDPHAERVHYRPLWFKPVGFVNLGLMYGVKRSGLKVGRTDLYGDDSLGARARDLVSSAPVRLADRVMEMYVRSNWKILSSLKVPWYMPEWIGGLGLPTWFSSTSGEYQGASLQDIATARRILRGWNEDRPLRVTNSEWKIRKLVQDRIGFAETPVEDTEVNEDVIRDSRRFFGECCVALLFQSGVAAADLREEVKDGGMNGRAYTRSYNHNRRLWTRSDRRLSHKELVGILPTARKLFDNAWVPTVDVYDVELTAGRLPGSV